MEEVQNLLEETDISTTNPRDGEALSCVAPRGAQKSKNPILRRGRLHKGGDTEGAFY